MAPFNPARFTQAERLTDAWRDAQRFAADRAFYVCEDAARVRRMKADRYASIDGLAQARVSLLEHCAQYVAAVRCASEWVERMQAAGLTFRADGEPTLSLGDDDAAELARNLAILDACNEAGEAAPLIVIFTVGQLAQVARNAS